MQYKKHTNCRICHTELPAPYLDLGMMPLSNNLPTEQGAPVDRYPLQVAFCPDCFLSQLTVVVPPGVLFSNYVYRSGISEGYKAHCRSMAADLQCYGINAYSSHIDIAGNDGTLLKQFRKVLGGSFQNRCVVDPAVNFSRENMEAGIMQHHQFWSTKLVERYHDLRDLDLITATNVFAHVDDARDFMQALNKALSRSGIAVLEFPYLVDFIERKEFDTVYFEHLSYFSLTPLLKLANECGLTVMDATRHEIHGGSLRVILGKTRDRKVENVDKILQLEYDNNLHQFKTYRDWSQDVQKTIKQFRELILKLDVHDKLNVIGNRVAAFAASAKGNVLLNAAGLTSNEIEYIIDETPEKKGKFSPGTGITITDFGYSYTWPDYMIILSWNFADEIKAKCRRLGYKGKFILPLTCEICD